MNIVVCDDNKVELNEVVEYCTKMVLPKDKIFFYEKSTELLNDLERNCKAVDIFILDIEMPELSGIELKNMIEKKYIKADIIFLSSHEEMMESAFGRNVVAFIKKDNWRDRLKGEIIKVQKDNEESIWIEDKKQSIEMKLKNIISFNAANYYSIVYFIRQDLSGERVSSILCKKSLKRWEAEIDNERFYRISKSVIVNFENIKYIHSDKVIMMNDEQYIIPRGKIKLFREKYYGYIKGHGRVI